MVTENMWAPLDGARQIEIDMRTRAVAGVPRQNKRPHPLCLVLTTLLGVEATRRRRRGVSSRDAERAE